MNEMEIFNRVTQTGIKVAGNVMPGLDDVLLPLGVVLGVVGAYFTYTMEDDLHKLKKVQDEHAAQLAAKDESGETTVHSVLTEH
jgi:hypothetical protein